MTNHKYQLKLTVGSDEYLADISFNEVLDTCFNKRHRRINDYGGQPYPSNANTLSGYLTNGIVISNENLEKIPKNSSFLWRGYRETQYSNYSGTVGKVGLVCENIIRNSDKNFYTTPIGGLAGLAGLDAAQYIKDNETYNLFGLGKEKEFISTNRTGVLIYPVNFERINLEKAKWGLDGSSNLEMRDRFGNDERRTLGTVKVSDTCLNAYTGGTGGSGSVYDLFEVDKQTETQTFDDITVSYDTWNCLFVCSNYHYGSTNGESYTQNDDYIFVNEWVLYKAIRVGQYNNPNTPYSEYPFKPSNCDIYYNMSTKKFEEVPASASFEGRLNYQIISKEDFESVDGFVKTNNFTVDLSTLQYTGSTSISEPEVIVLDQNNITSSVYINDRTPYRFYAVGADENKIYLGGGYQLTNTTSLYSYNIADLLQQPETLSLTLEMTSNIGVFLNDNYRKNLYKIACIPTVSISGVNSSIGPLFDKESGLVNDYGFINWLCSGTAEFENVSISSGQTFKFELVETITDN